MTMNKLRKDLQKIKNKTKEVKDDNKINIKIIAAGVNDLNFERLERLLKEYYHKAPEDERENILQDLYHINIQLKRYRYHEFERFKEEYDV